MVQRVCPCLSVFLFLRCLYLGVLFLGVLFLGVFFLGVLCLGSFLSVFFAGVAGVVGVLFVRFFAVPFPFLPYLCFVAVLLLCTGFQSQIGLWQVVDLQTMMSVSRYHCCCRRWQQSLLSTSSSQLFVKHRDCFSQHLLNTKNRWVYEREPRSPFEIVWSGV